jgi:hypothetical protein
MDPGCFISTEVQVSFFGEQVGFCYDYFVDVLSRLFPFRRCHIKVKLVSPPDLQPSGVIQGILNHVVVLGHQFAKSCRWHRGCSLPTISDKDTIKPNELLDHTIMKGMPVACNLLHFDGV